MCNARSEVYCNDASDQDILICSTFNCTAGRWKCQNAVQCIWDTRVCDGNPPGILGRIDGCDDFSDEDPAMCVQWNCPAFYTKCADNLQCIPRDAICDGRYNCIDESDERCNDRCLIKPLEAEEIDIVKKCQEDRGACVSIKQYCDGIAQCPEASDETQAGCTCEIWDLRACRIEDHQQTNCINTNWAPANGLNASEVDCLASVHSMTRQSLMVDNNTGMYPSRYISRYSPFIPELFLSNLLTNE